MPSRSVIITVFSTLALGASVAILIAGPLDPPAGAVSSTYKTLTEVEPRTVINATNTPGDADSLYKITQPGSYYLNGNITGVINKHGIEIAASGVTIDLSGFELVGVRGTETSHGIVATGTGLHNVVVRNGVVREWGGAGVNLSPTIVSGGEVVDIRAVDNVNSGIFVHSYFRVAGCTASGNGGSGIWAVNSSLIENCQTFSNQGGGILCSSGHTVLNCVSYGNGATGILCSDAGTITGCSSYNNDGVGISAGAGSTVPGCTVRSNDLDGIVASSASSILNNTCSNNGTAAASGAGILVTGAANRIEGNHCSTNDRGIDINGSRNRIDANSCIDNSVSFDISGADNIVIRNTATGGSPNYSIAAGNSVAPRVSVADSDGWASISNANHPWANFGH